MINGKDHCPKGFGLFLSFFSFFLSCFLTGFSIFKSLEYSKCHVVTWMICFGFMSFAYVNTTSMRSIHLSLYHQWGMRDSST